MVLSKQENAVIILLCQGFSCKEISDKLQISPRTVETYIERLMYKLRARNRLELVAIYVRQYERLK